MILNLKANLKFMLHKVPMTASSSKKKILIYDHDDQQVKLFESSLSPDKYQLTITKDMKTVSSSFDYAFISLNLPAIEIDSKVKIICTSNPKMPQVTSQKNYRPLVSLTAPITKPEIIRALDSIHNNHIEGGSLFLNNLLDLKVNLKSIINEIVSSPIVDTSLIDSLKKYCTRECSSSQDYSSKQEREFKTEELVELDFAGHMKICQKRPGCKLCKFQEYMNDKHKKTSTMTIRELLGNLETLILDELDSKITSYLDEVIQLKTGFCTSQCEQMKDDMNFRPGDILLVSYEDLLKGECHYCATQDCNINKFFGIFLNTINTIDAA